MNQFEASKHRLTLAAAVRDDLDAAYGARQKNPVRIAYLNDHLRHNMAMARMHAHLAEVEALYDLRASVDVLFQALTADPDEIPARPPLELIAGTQTGEYRCPNCGQATYSGTCPDCADGLLK